MTDIFGLRGASWLEEQAACPTRAPSANAHGLITPETKRATEVTLVRGSDVVMRPIPWLWDGYIAGGKMTILGGSPGTGKTTAALALAATVTVGGRWPDGAKAEQGNVAIWSAEDDISDTLAPRLALCGADLSRVLFVGETLRLDERGAFDPSRDMEALRHALQEAGGCRLLIVDPVVSAVAGDSHKNAEVRRGLQPLVNLAANSGAAIIGITHLSKATEGRDPIDRISGSLAFGALARTVLMTASGKDRDGAITRLLLRAKSNLSANGGGFKYDIEQGEVQGVQGVFASRVLWGDAVEGDARELLAAAEAVGGEGAGAEAEAFLIELLGSGPVPTNVIKSDANGAGISWRTIERAKHRLKVVTEKTGMRGGWEWRLPMPHEREGRHTTPKAATVGNGVLQENLAAFDGPEPSRVSLYEDDYKEVEV